MSLLQTTKLWIVGHAGLAKDALHVYIGLAVLLTSVALFRWPLRSWKPWTLVALVAIAGEVWDLRDSLVYDTPVVLSANWHDIWNTLFWPTVMTMLARWTTLLRR